MFHSVGFVNNTNCDIKRLGANGENIYKWVTKLETDFKQMDIVIAGGDESALKKGLAALELQVEVNQRNNEDRFSMISNRDN